MRVLVTGGNGYIGAHITRDLAKAGHQVIVYDNLSSSRRRDDNGVLLIQGDIADRSKLNSSLSGVEAVVHLAGAAYVEESVRDPRKYFHLNVASGLLLLDAALAARVKYLIFSSSCAVYGIPQSVPIAENTPLSPINPYGSSKLSFEHALCAYSFAYGIRYVALRYFNASGAHPSGDIGEDHNPETHLIPLALRSALQVIPPITIYGTRFDTPDGSSVRDFTHVCDISLAHVAALEYLQGGGESIALNIGTGNGTSVIELLKKIENITGRRVPHIIGGPRLGDPPVLYADISRSRSVLSWIPRYTVDDIIESAWRWELKRSRLRL